MSEAHEVYQQLCDIRDSGIKRSSWDEALRMCARERLRTDKVDRRQNSVKRDRLTRDQAYRLYKRQNGKCQRCKDPFSISDLTDDHIQPIIEGGTNDMRNRRLICKRCNSEKGGSSPILDSKRTGQTILEMLPPQDDVDPNEI